MEVVRDYIHVDDLVEGHLILKIFNMNSNYKVYNLGSGIGYSVFELINAMTKYFGKSPI